jgi:hypothetical protein
MLLSVVVYPFAYRQNLTRNLRELAIEHGLRGLIGPTTLVLTDESLIEITESIRSEAKWKDMDRVDEVGDYTFIMVTSSTAAIVPRHGFEQESDYIKVRDFAKSRVGRRD